jgi:hypothetical protein
MLMTRIFLPILYFSALVLALSSCNLLDTKTELEKTREKVAQDWVVDSVRVREYGFIPGTPAQFPLAKDTLLAITRMKFSQSAGSLKSALLQTTVVKGKTNQIEIFWSSQKSNSISLYYSNPNTFVYDIEVIYDIVELTDSKFHFKRSENLVSNNNGAQYGRLDTDTTCTVNAS